MSAVALAKAEDGKPQVCPVGVTVAGALWAGEGTTGALCIKEQTLGLWFWGKSGDLRSRGGWRELRLEGSRAYYRGRNWFPSSLHFFGRKDQR